MLHARNIQLLGLLLNTLMLEYSSEYSPVSVLQNIIGQSLCLEYSPEYKGQKCKFCPNWNIWAKAIDAHILQRTLRLAKSKHEPEQSESLSFLIPIYQNHQ